eukprot:1152162-Pelagomonas_calceolata.AAC.9
MKAVVARTPTAAGNASKSDGSSGRQDSRSCGQHTRELLRATHDKWMKAVVARTPRAAGKAKISVTDSEGRA